MQIFPAHVYKRLPPCPRWAGWRFLLPSVPGFQLRLWRRRRRFRAAWRWGFLFFCWRGAYGSFHHRRSSSLTPVQLSRCAAVAIWSDAARAWFITAMPGTPITPLMNNISFCYFSFRLSPEENFERYIAGVKAYGWVSDCARFSYLISCPHNTDVLIWCFCWLVIGLLEKVFLFYAIFSLRDIDDAMALLIFCKARESRRKPYHACCSTRNRLFLNSYLLNTWFERHIIMSMILNYKPNILYCAADITKRRA